MLRDDPIATRVSRVLSRLGDPEQYFARGTGSRTLPTGTSPLEEATDLPYVSATASGQFAGGGVLERMRGRARAPPSCSMPACKNASPESVAQIALIDCSGFGWIMAASEVAEGAVYARLSSAARSLERCSFSQLLSTYPTIYVVRRPPRGGMPFPTS